jgi:hypothetical protein
MHEGRKDAAAARAQTRKASGTDQKAIVGGEEANAFASFRPR